MPNKRKICTEHNTANQNTFIAALNSWYPIENVLNSGYRKVLDFKENAEKILEKEAKETLTMEKFAEAIYSNRQFGIKVVNNCIILSCYITLEKDKDIKKKRNDLTPPATPVPSASNQQIHNLLASIERPRFDSAASSSAATDYYDEYGLTSPINFTGINSQSSFSLSKIDINNNSSSPTTLNASGSSAQISGGAKKVNVEVIMKSNPLRVDENEKTTRMELIRSGSDNNMLRFTYYVKPECEVKKFRDTNTEMFEKGNLIVFTNDFFTIYKCSTTGKSIIALNEIIQNQDQEVRTEALGEKLATLLSSRPRHRALLTNECKLNHALSNADNANRKQGDEQVSSTLSSQEDETYYTRELIHIYGQPIVPSFHKHFNYQLSNTHYGYRTLRRLLNCDILKKYVKITKEEIKSLDRVVEFVQLTEEGCLKAFKLNLTTFYDPNRFQNGIVKGYMDVWYVDRLKERYGLNESTINKDFLCSSLPQITQSPWSSATTPKTDSCFLQTTSCELEGTECDQTNHLWFCLQDYGCKRIEEFMLKIQDYITIKNNKSELILVHTLYPVFEYKDILSEARRILSSFLNNSVTNVCLNELVTSNLPIAAREHVESLLNKYINLDSEKKIMNFTALFEILLILKRELSKEKNDEMKYSHFLCTLERAHHEKLKLAIAQLKCVPCLNKFTTNFSLTQTPGNTNTPKTMVNHANMSRLLKQMSLIVSTELQQVAIEIFEVMDDDKPVKYIKLKDEFKSKQKLQLQTQQSQQQQQQTPQQQPQSIQLQTQQSQQQHLPHIQSNTNNQNNGTGTPASIKPIQKPSQPLFAPRNLLSSLNQQQQQTPQQQQQQLQYQISSNTNTQLQTQQARILANINQSQQQQQQLRSLNNTNDHSNNPHLLQNAAAAVIAAARAAGIFNPHASLQSLQDITDKLDTTFVTDPNNTTNANHSTYRS